MKILFLLVGLLSTSGYSDLNRSSQEITTDDVEMVFGEIAQYDYEYDRFYTGHLLELELSGEGCGLVESQVEATLVNKEKVQLRALGDGFFDIGNRYDVFSFTSLKIVLYQDFYRSITCKLRVLFRAD